MCAIVDANVRDEVFGQHPSEAGRLFLDWLNTKSGRLVIGGRLTDELRTSETFEKWLARALSVGRAFQIPDDSVALETRRIEAAGTLESNDSHVLALARVSRTRLLFSNDRALQRDFKTGLGEGARGVIYTTARSAHATRSHRQMLRRRDICWRVA